MAVVAKSLAILHRYLSTFSFELFLIHLKRVPCDSSAASFAFVIVEEISKILYPAPFKNFLADGPNGLSPVHYSDVFRRGFQPLFVLAENSDYVPILTKFNSD